LDFLWTTWKPPPADYDLAIRYLRPGSRRERRFGKQRSPFRYPGGKTWLVPRVRRWLASLPQTPARLIEPFAGGAIIGLTAAAEKLAEHVILVELDEDVFDLDHARLFEIAQGLAGEVLITYDQAPEISDMAYRSGFQVRAVAMSNTHHAAMQELLIGRNLDWR